MLARLSGWRAGTTHGDYDGDGKTDPAVWRPSSKIWYVHNIGAWQWGIQGDISVQADYRGNGKSDIAVWRPGNGTWYIRLYGVFNWGIPGDIPVIK